MQLLSVLDPRDNLEKIRKDDLLKYAAENGYNFTEQMPATLMRLHLREMGVTQIHAPTQDFAGQATNTEQVQQAEEAKENPSISAEDLVRQQFASGAYNLPPDYTKMTLPKLRKLAKEKGIKQERGENGKSLIAKLEAFEAEQVARRMENLGGEDTS